MAAKPENLLVIIADEHRRDALGCMGHPVVRTPNLDALAARGTVFENAYTPSPICVPTRAALATGQYIHRTGHWDSAAPYCGAPKSWMHAIRERGVNVLSFGKLHFRSASDDNGFVREVLPMHVLDGRGWTEGLLREEALPYEGARELAAGVGSGETEYTAYDRAVCAAAEDWIGRSAGTAPWAAFVSFVTPHYPLSAPDEFMRMYDTASIPAPAACERPAGGTHPELDHLARFFAYGQHFTPERVAEARAAYFALVTFMDSCVGRVLAALDASGQAGNTRVIYLSDHGEMLGDHGFWTKSVMYEASVGIPMIVAGPSVPAGHRVATPVSLLDVAATAAEQFGAEPFRDGLPGRSLQAIANEPDDPGRTVFSEYHDGGSSTASFMVRWDDWKFVYYAGLAPQLFNLADDPDECTDLGQSRATRDIAARIEGSRRLQAICDPDAVNRMAFDDQRRRIAEFGGSEACRATAFGHTPAPVQFTASAL